MSIELVEGGAIFSWSLPEDSDWIGQPAHFALYDSSNPWFDMNDTQVLETYVSFILTPTGSVFLSFDNSVLAEDCNFQLDAGLGEPFQVIGPPDQYYFMTPGKLIEGRNGKVDTCQTETTTTTSTTVPETTTTSTVPSTTTTTESAPTTTVSVSEEEESTTTVQEDTTTTTGPTDSTSLVTLPELNCEELIAQGLPAPTHCQFRTVATVEAAGPVDRSSSSNLASTGWGSAGTLLMLALILLAVGTLLAKPAIDYIKTHRN